MQYQLQRAIKCRNALEHKDKDKDFYNIVIRAYDNCIENYQNTILFLRAEIASNSKRSKQSR